VSAGAALRPLSPIACAHLFRPLNDALIDVLRRLDGDGWVRPTLAPQWRVRDVAAHLLDGQLRKLSFGRDGHRLDSGPIDSYRDLVRFIDRLNDAGVRYGERLSPRVLIDLLASVGPAVADYVSSLAPEGEAVFAVAWAGESRSTHWMDIAREYTEWWHHQMQIRAAVGAPLLLGPTWFDPLIETSMRALPVACRDVAAPEGTAVAWAIDAERPRHFAMVRGAGAWQVLEGVPDAPAASLGCHADTAWRVLFNALPPAEARRRVDIRGDTPLAEATLGARSVMV
jgi:hypothetical protein